MSKARNQKGSISLVNNGSGKQVWVFRWRETKPDGSLLQRKKQIGSLERFKNKAAAERGARDLRLLLTSGSMIKRITMGEMIQHYCSSEMEEMGPEGKASSTRARYRSYLFRWIEPRWGATELARIKTIEVEQWLRKIDRAPGTKSKIRNIMSALFNHAIRWEYATANPIAGISRGSGVRQSAKREHAPDVLEIGEMRALLRNLGQRERLLVLLDMTTGLRRGELAGLKWSDVDFSNLQLNIRRSVVDQVVGRCKTEASRKPVPLDPHVAQELRAWRAQTRFCKFEDWVFASNSNRAGRNRGLLALCLATVMRYHIQPAARRIGITKRVTWHTFRHTFSTLLMAHKEDVKVVQELMRHASSRITLDVYSQAVTPSKREAQSRIAKLIQEPDSALESRCVPENVPGGKVEHGLSR